jgi:hypothetical protein
MDMKYLVPESALRAERGMANGELSKEIKYDEIKESKISLDEVLELNSESSPDVSHQR